MADQSSQQSSSARKQSQQLGNQISEQQDRLTPSNIPASSRSSHQQQQQQQQQQPPQQVYYAHQPYSSGGGQQSFRPYGPVSTNQEQFGFDAMMHGFQQMDFRQQMHNVSGNRDGGRNFHHGSGLSLLGSIQPMQPRHPFPSHNAGQGLSQSYYMPQQPQIMPPQYYGGRPEMQSAGMAGMAAQHSGQGYYSGQAPAPNYYYPQPSHYTYQHYHVHDQGTSRNFSAGASGQYSSSLSPRRSSQSAAATGYYRQDGAESFQKSNQRSNHGQGQTPATALVRGPPRKPKQSGHAIWIGNLPPHTDLMSLVHHVCQQTTGLISLFLISKSNCAFANYPDEKLCIEAQQKLNDSYYMSVSLVSRLRKNSVEGLPSANTSLELAAVSPSPQSPRARGKSDDGTGLSSGATDADYIQGGTSLRKPTVQTSVIVDGSDKSATMGKSYDGSDWTSSSVPAATNSGIPVKGDKYFILKSLTLRDLELSVQSGIWATQSHNEETLNEAYKTCDNVYLIFSANKSGEYFGYARMASEINQDPAAAIEFAPTSQSFTDADIPKAIPTEATETTPRGRIVDDSARGTIFWEIQSNDADSPDDKEREDGEQAHPIEVPPAADGLDDVPGTDNTDGDDVFVASGDSQTWGKPFKLVWLSTTRLPFYRTRGLRNPLNANREIKIARDGTDVDVTIGRKLVSLFHQEAANSSAAGTGGGTGNSLGVSSSSSYASLPGTRAP